MFDLLTKSAIRKKIILLFLYNREKEFYLSEIARHAGTTAGTARRELIRLLDADFLSFKKKGNLSLFLLNPRCALLNEIEAIVRKTLGIEVELRRALSGIKGVSFAFLFGSYVSGNLKWDSDIDLFIVGKPDENEIYRAVRKVEEMAGRDIQYHISAEDEFAAKSGTSAFHKEILAKPLMLIGGKDELQQLAR